MTFTGLTNTNLPPIDQIVGEDGTIELLLIGKLVAAGKTPEQLRGDILNAIVPDRNPRLRSWFAPFEQFFFVQGQVKQPGRYPYSGELTVIKAIDTAGGFSDFADRKQVRLIREGDAIFIVNCDKIQKDPSQDPRILPGDQLRVPLRKWRWPFGK